MSLYSEVAAEILEAFQGDLEAAARTFTRQAPPTNDLVEGTVVPGATTTWALPVLLLPASQGTIEAFDARFMVDVLAEVNVRFGISPGAAGQQPRVNDTCDLYGDGRAWLVMGSTAVDPIGDGAIVYSVGYKLP